MTIRVNAQHHTQLTYALLVFIWASTPLAIVWSVQDIYPLWALALRFFLALPFALTILWLMKAHLPLSQIALQSYIAGALSFIGSQLFTYLATDYLSSGMIALMFGLAPIITGLIGYFIFATRLRASQWVGMLIAVFGLSVICLSSSDQHIQPIGIGLMLLSVVIYCISMFWVKKINAPVTPIAQATGSIIISTILSCVMLPFIWQHAPTEMPGAKSLFALSYAVIMASLIAMFCYFKLVRQIEAATLSLTTVMTPVLALALGTLLNDEYLSRNAMLGALVLLSGLLVYFAQEIKASRVFGFITK